MRDERSLYTLAEVAAALGRTNEKPIRARLGVPSGLVDVRGKRTEAWSEAVIFSFYGPDLEHNRHRHACRTVAHLLRVAVHDLRLYEHDFSPSRRECLAARERRDTIAPLLKRLGSANVAEVAREACARFARVSRQDGAPAFETVCGWIREALRRDGNWQRLEREELYYSFTREAAPIEKETALCPPIDAPVAALLEEGGAEGGMERVLWNATLHAYEATLAAGQSPSAARAAAIAALAVPGAPLEPLAANVRAARKRFAYTLEKWQKNGRDLRALLHGCNPEARTVRRARPPKFCLTKAEQLALQNLRLKKGSFALAIEWFRSDPACLPGTRELITAELDRAARGDETHGIREPAWPDSLRRAGHVTAEAEALFRGPKHYQSIEPAARRGGFYVDEQDQRQTWFPNAIWESDDMSSNEPFTWLEPGEKGETVHRIGRQTLCTADVYSCAFLGTSLIGRERDAYRAEDQAEHMLDCVREHGLPLAWRIERGPWENNFIDGIAVPGREERWGGLGAIVHIIRAWKSKQKGTIENSFDLLQSMLAHESTSIGRFRGEFEAQTKLFLAASRGDVKAWERFWPIGECAEGFKAAMQEFNQRPKQRYAHGVGKVVPADLYHPAAKKELRQEDEWRFSPEKRLVTIRRGFIECRSRHYPFPFRFRAHGESGVSSLEHGYKVLIAFHPGHPERGCHIFNAETGSFNREGYSFGEKIMLAPMAEDAPQFDLSPRERQMQARKNATAAVRAESRNPITSRGVAGAASRARNGFGHSVEVARGGTLGNHSYPAGSKPDPRHEAMKEEARREYEEEELRRLDRAEAEILEREGRC